MTSLKAHATINISFQDYPNSSLRAIIINGELEYGDEKKFYMETASIDRAVIFLNSPGGNVLAAMEIGRIIRLKHYTTSVIAKDLCASACALIWLAGENRFLEDGAALGFHAAFIEKDGRLLEKGVANALIGRYLTQINLSEAAIIFITSAPPEGMNWLNRENAAINRIDLTFIDPKADANENPKPPNTTTAAAEPYDPITAASKFYRYLSDGKGSAASAIIIPEKRGKGPFNEKNMTEFFSSLSSPLKVNSISRIDENQVAVNYSYSKPNGDKCNATANVFTVYMYGRTLIEKIIAKC